MNPCPNDPGLYRYLYKDSVCFVLQYVDDALIAGEQLAVDCLKKELGKYFQCKFAAPKDFLGLDLDIQQPGDIKLSMRSFTSKMQQVMEINDPFPGEVATPGRTDKKINRLDEHQANDKYRSHVASLNWLTMGLRYDLAFVTKELSRMLTAPTQVGNEIIQRALVYTVRTQHAYLHFSHTKIYE